MPAAEHLLIIGASARAAAFSALRAGLRPWCVDLFADADLRAACPAVALPPGHYPDGFWEAARPAPPGPWLYTGGLENRPALVQQLAQTRTLWGNDAAVLRRVRSPRSVAALLRDAGLPCPRVFFRAEDVPRQGRWLVKPRAGAGGTGIRPWTGQALRKGSREVYFQEWVEGEPCAAIYVSDGQAARLLGVTRQLVGVPWLHARPFAYCGSIGPLDPPPPLKADLERLGDVLVWGTGLQGLFGVDCLVNEAGPWPVEVNPRYTASVEVLELALGLPALALHRRAFDPSAPPPGNGPATAGHIGKAVLFAPADVRFPPKGPWQDALAGRAGQSPWVMPPYADVPAAGQLIPAGRPILTVFARAASASSCREALRSRAEAVLCLPGPDR